MSSNAQTWDAAAATYDAERQHDGLYHRCIEAARRATLWRNPARILDAGCGTGLATASLCTPHRTVVGMDYSHGSLRVLQHKKLGIHIAQGDCTALPFPTGSFDAVLCANTLQHLTPSQQPFAIAELQRVTRPGGQLVITVHHYSREKQRTGWIKEGKPGQPGIDYIFRFNVDELRRLLPRATISAIGLSTRFERYLPQRIRQWFANRGDGHMLLAVSQASGASQIGAPQLRRAASRALQERRSNDPAKQPQNDHRFERDPRPPGRSQRQPDEQHTGE
jgi:ubiquinone/menaquinone biosynthesis C-methylase UbiE